MALLAVPVLCVCSTQQDSHSILIASGVLELLELSQESFCAFAAHLFIGQVVMQL